MTVLAQIKDLAYQSLLYRGYVRVRWWWLGVFVAPRTTALTVHGVQLDLHGVPLRMREFILRGKYEEYERECCQLHLTAEDTVLELGGAIGFIGLYCQKRLGITRYVTVEANPQTVGLLRRNYEVNGLVPQVLTCAVGGHDGTVKLHASAEFWRDSTEEASGCADEREIEVRAATLPALLGEIGFRPTVLIIDIEGAERHIDFRAVPAEVKKIILETHPRAIGVEATYHVLGTLVGLGFGVVAQRKDVFVLLRREPA